MSARDDLERGRPQAEIAHPNQMSASSADVVSPAESISAVAGREGGLRIVEIHQDGRVVRSVDGRTCLRERLDEIDLVPFRLEAFLESLGEECVWLNKQESHRHPSM